LVCLARSMRNADYCDPASTFANSAVERFSRCTTGQIRHHGSTHGAEKRLNDGSARRQGPSLAT
jgi:hypothetical protein